MTGESNIVGDDTLPGGGAVDLLAEAKKPVSSLPGSLKEDLSRFLSATGSGDLLPVLAASVRHSCAVEITLLGDFGKVALAVSPRAQLFDSTFDLLALDEARFVSLRVLHVDPGVRDPARRFGRKRGHLGTLLWRAALFGSHDTLLPEIGGRVCYRLAAGYDMGDLQVPAQLLPLFYRLHGSPAPLHELEQRDSERPQVCRLLNALYLQSALMISRRTATRARNLALLWE